MRRLMYLLAAVVAAAFVVGCGGSGSDGAPFIDSLVRDLSASDSLTYNVNGSVTQPEVDPETGEEEDVTYLLSGTMSIDTNVETRTPNYGEKCFRVRRSYNLTSEIGTFQRIVTDYIEQDVDKTLYYVGYNIGNDTRRVTSAASEPVQYDGHVDVGDAYTFAVTYNDGSSETVTRTVVKHEKLDDQWTYKITHSSQQTNATVTYEEWFVPGYGYPSVRTETWNDGNRTIRVTARLATKSF